MSSARGYGTAISFASATENGRGGVHDEEQQQQPLLSKPPPRPATAWLRTSLVVDVQRDWADIVLLFCYAITGLLDSSATSVWGSFVSMQTGNTVYLGLGLTAPHESTRWIKSGTSLCFFCIGSFCFSRFHRFFSPRRRWVLCASFMLQAILTAAAALIMTFAPTSRREDIGWNVLLSLALVAFQSCGQAVTSRALKYNSLTSVVLTSIYCDLFSDAELFVPRNPERNRRGAAPVLLLFGACMGGLLARSPVGIAGALWIAAGLKFLIVLLWFLWPAEEETR